MKIGIFDSGLGGLIIAKAIFKFLPKYDYVYFGDTKNLPYGEKSPKQIYEFTKAGVDFLFKQNCQIVILACNTASALALRRIQQDYLPKFYPNRRVLGVVIPTLEEANPKNKKIAVIGTTATINSHIYKKELVKINSQTKIFEIPTPDLVPLIEQNSLQKAKKSLESYLKPFIKQGLNALILGCTHYPLLKEICKNVLGEKVKIISQDEIIPFKLQNYIKRHREISKVIGQNKSRDFFVSKINKNFLLIVRKFFNKIKLNLYEP